MFYGSGDGGLRCGLGATLKKKKKRLNVLFCFCCCFVVVFCLFLIQGAGYMGMGLWVGCRLWRLLLRSNI